jgi:hypothetical protein
MASAPEHMIVVVDKVQESPMRVREDEGGEGDVLSAASSREHAPAWLERGLARLGEGIVDFSSSETQIGDAGLRLVLDSLTQWNVLAFKEIDLSNNKLTDASMPALVAFLKKREMRVGHLNLACNSLWHQGLGALAGSAYALATLEALTLDNNHFGDYGIKLFCNALYTRPEACRLTALSLAQCHLTDAGGLHLTTMLKDNASITELNLDDNVIGDAVSRDLGALLASNQTLVHLSLRGNHIGTQGVGALEEGARKHPTLLTLRLEHNTAANHTAGVLALEKAKRAIEANLYLRVAKIKFVFCLGLHSRVGVKSSMRFLLDEECSTLEPKDLPSVLAPVWDFLGQV